MTFHAPWGQPSYKKTRKKRKAKKKAKKKKAKKKTRRKVKKKAKKKAKKAKKKARRAPRARRAVVARVVVSKKDLEKIRKNVARPKWMDQLPASKRKVFKFKGKSYWPLYSLLYVVDAVEVVPLSKWDGPTHRELRGSLLRPGYVQTISRKKYVYVKSTQFIQKGSPIDV
jgi:hypothetical protein